MHLNVGAVSRIRPERRVVRVVEDDVPGRVLEVPRLPGHEVPTDRHVIVGQVLPVPRAPRRGMDVPVVRTRVSIELGDQMLRAIVVRVVGEDRSPRPVRHVVRAVVAARLREGQLLEVVLHRGGQDEVESAAGRAEAPLEVHALEPPEFHAPPAARLRRVEVVQHVRGVAPVEHPREEDFRPPGRVLEVHPGLPGRRIDHGGDVRVERRVLIFEAVHDVVLAFRARGTAEGLEPR